MRTPNQRAAAPRERPGWGSRFSLVGHDWGAALAWRMASALPRRVRRLVAISVGHPGMGRYGLGLGYLELGKEAAFPLLLCL